MKISELKGVGEKTEKLFNKLSIYNAEDLLTFYPRKYDVFEEPVLVSKMTEEKKYALWGTVASNCEYNPRSRVSIISVFVSDDNGNTVKMTWFNRPYLRNQLKRGFKFMFRGEAAFRGSLIFMEQPEIYSYEEYCKKTNTMQPIYNLTAGLTNNIITKAVKQVFDIFDFEDEYLPDDIIQKAGLISYKDAVYGIHFPKDFEQLKEARKRIVFDEFFMFTLSIRCRKDLNLTEDNHIIIDNSKYSKIVLDNLGYELTNAQKCVCKEINKDMTSNHKMNRLVQGDVGSGKTIVALLSMLDAAYAGYQSVIMAPTEVLASQHYENFCDIIEKNNLPVKCVLLTGSLTAAQKKKAHNMLKCGDAQIIVGTHALITEKVEYANLGLVITDEQHRFGVRQREALHLKGNKPHILVMSATPIPRSLAIILYGDLDISIIDEKPAMRLPIKNCVVDNSYRPNAYRFITNEVNKGHQAYVICAMAKNDGDEEEKKLENVIDYADKLRNILPKEIIVEYLHGKMKPSLKNDIMDRFARKEIDVLVSTTVVEVGINVPNATVMMVENAERFGLSGLHQLRGRVGRGDTQSYCIFVSNTKNSLTKQRLNILKDSNDGFYISEQDLKLRGPGDILGERQSGDFGFVLGDIFVDAAVLKLSADIAGEILDKDSNLEDNKNHQLRVKLEEYGKNNERNLNL